MSKDTSREVNMFKAKKLNIFIFIPPFLTEEAEDKTARNNRRDLSRYVYTDGVHQQEVLRILGQTHLMHDTARHRKCGNTGRTDHGVDLVLAEKVEDFRAHNTADGIEYEREKTEHHNNERFNRQERVRLHLESNRDTKKQGDNVRESRLRRFGQRFQHAAFTE